MNTAEIQICKAVFWLYVKHVQLVCALFKFLISSHFFFLEYSYRFLSLFGFFFFYINLIFFSNLQISFLFLFLYLDSSLLLPNLRKSKRIRTAFSPTQLLQLEHAFEKNHYVVGQERKELALKLGLSETQVKCHCLSLTLNSDT